MKILVIGSGGREHAIVWRLSRDNEQHEIFCAPGNAGTAELAWNVAIDAENIDELAKWAEAERPDLTVVGPEIPLCLGVADKFAALGLRVFGPCAAGAKMEGSKQFAKEIMSAAGVPTAKAATFSEVDAALAALPEFGLPVVIKADGLAAGKGVLICETLEDAERGVKEILGDRCFGDSGATILVEQFLRGEEASLLALVDGKDVKILPSAQDHKRALDGDQGLNTGGMGAYSPAPIVTPELEKFALEKIFLPVVEELRARGITYKGILYGGLMIGDAGVNVLEFNCRFGDPETQVVLPRIGGNFAELLAATADGKLGECALEIVPEHCATVVMASGGYPGHYEKGKPIDGLDNAPAIVFHAGTAFAADGSVVTSGGRVLAVTALGKTLREAVDKAYVGVGAIHFENEHHRKDIAHRAL